MAERIVEIEGRRVRVGTMADAGRLCVTDRAPNGVSARTYQFYSSSRSRLVDPAPGPLMIRDLTDPTNEDLVPLRDPGTGAQLVDLDAVDSWHARRPGRGGVSGGDPETAQTLRRTEMRERMLVAARNDQLTVIRATRWGWQTFVGDEQLPGRRAGQIRTQLQQLNLLTAPDPAGPKQQRLALLPAGVEVLNRWEVSPNET